MNVNNLGTSIYAGTITKGPDGADSERAESVNTEKQFLAADEVTFSDEAQVMIGTDPFDPKKKED